MFIFRHYKDTDFYGETYEGWEVGYFYWERDIYTKEINQKFQRVATYSLRTEAAEFVHWLNGGMSYKYDNRTKT